MGGASEDVESSCLTGPEMRFIEVIGRNFVNRMIDELPENVVAAALKRMKQVDDNPDVR